MKCGTFLLWYFYYGNGKSNRGTVIVVERVFSLAKTIVVDVFVIYIPRIPVWYFLLWALCPRSSTPHSMHQLEPGVSIGTDSWGGIEGLHQYTWVILYEAALRLTLEQLEFKAETLVRGDDWVAAIHIPRKALENRDTPSWFSQSRQPCRQLVMRLARR